MPSIILPHRWRKQPQGIIRPDWSHPFLRDCDGVYDGRVLHTPSGTKPPAYSSTPQLLNTPYGVGRALTGAANSVHRFDGLRTTTGVDPYTVEVLAFGSSYPSLANVVTSGPYAFADGTVNTSGENGQRRGVISYSGASDPYNIYVWGYSCDADTGDAWQAGALQHVVMVKGGGASSAPVTVYRNGVVIYSGSLGVWSTTGQYLYIGGRHSAGAAAMVGTVLLATCSRREISEAEVLERYKNQWQIFKPLTKRIWIPSTAAGGDTNINCTPGAAVAAGVTASVTQAITVNSVVGNAVAAGITAAIELGGDIEIAAQVGNAIAAGIQAGVSVDQAITAVVGDAVAAGVSATVTQAITINCTVGGAIATGPDATISLAGSISLSEADIAAIWDHEIVSGVSARLMMKAMMAALAGKREGLGTATELYYDQDGTTVRITFSPTDEAGNGTPVVDGS